MPCLKPKAGGVCTLTHHKLDRQFKMASMQYLAIISDYCSALRKKNQEGRCREDQDHLFSQPGFAYSTLLFFESRLCCFKTFRN